MTTTQGLAEYRDAVRGFTAAHARRSDVRAVVEGDREWDEPAWDVAAKQLGVPGLLIPEALGGSGAGLAVAGTAVKELAAALAPGPYLGTVVAGATLADVPDSFANDLASIAQGNARFAVAYPTFDTPADLKVDGDDGEARLTGTLAAVADAAVATHLLLVAGAPDAPHLCAVPTANRAVEQTALRSIDPTRKLAAVTFDEAPARIVDVAPALVARWRDVAATLVGAEQAGVVRAVVDTDVEYAQQRFAFGRPVGSFQAVKHQLAEFFCVHEQVESMLEHALIAHDDAPEARRQATLGLQCLAGPAAIRVATEGLRLLGGIGFTWEHDAHLRMRRAISDASLLGNPYRHRRELAGILGLTS